MRADYFSVECDVCYTPNEATHHYCDNCLANMRKGYEEEIKELKSRRDDLLAACRALISATDKYRDAPIWVEYSITVREWYCRYCNMFGATRDDVEHDSECPVVKVKAAIAKAEPSAV